MEKDTTFIYSYSAKENKEVQEIRKKYLPQEESKLDELRRLDSAVQTSGMMESLCAGIGGALLAMFQSSVQAAGFTSAMTYEILLIVVIGGIGSVTGSVIGAFLFVACSEWWLRFLDQKQMIGTFEVPLLRNGFRLVVFSIIIMIVVLFFRQGIMGTKELPDLFGRKKNLKREVKA